MPLREHPDLAAGPCTQDKKAGHLERKIRRVLARFPKSALTGKNTSSQQCSFKPKTRRLPSHRLPAADPPFPPPSTEVRHITIG